MFDSPPQDTVLDGDDAQNMAADIAAEMQQHMGNMADIARRYGMDLSEQGDES